MYRASLFCMLSVKLFFFFFSPRKLFAEPGTSLSCARLSDLEWDDGGGEEAGAPEGAGQQPERRSQAAADRAEGRAADPEVSEQCCGTHPPPD